MKIAPLARSHSSHEWHTETDVASLAGTPVDGIIRIRDSEFDSIPFECGYFGHFNLECAGHIPGQTYILARIITPGYYNSETGEELLPVLSFADHRRAQCVSCTEFIAYEYIISDMFKYSMSHIYDKVTLQHAIVDRYSVSLPNISADEILSRGVAFTLLKFV